MSAPYEKSWKHFAFKQRNDRIRRFWGEGMKFNMICKRFGLSAGQVRTILKEERDGQEAQVKLRPFEMDKRKGG